MSHARTAALLLVAGLAGSAAADTVTGSVIVREGDNVGESTVSTINSPFTNGNGQVGIVLGLADGRRAVWYDTGAVFVSDEALPDILSGGEGTMGIGNNGQFIYSPAVNNNDAVWGQNGLILAEGDAAPGYGANFLSVFNSRPQMIDDGSGYWVGGVNDGAGGTSTVQRALFRSNPNGTIDRVIGSGDLIANSGGLTVDFPSGIDFDYHVSGGGAHRINVFVTDAASNPDVVAVNDGMVAREGFATGSGDNWQSFDHVTINDSGTYAFSGDTDAASSADEFIAVNGAIALREGDVLDGLTLGSSVNALSINNLNQAAFIWSNAEETETLFFASDALNMASAIGLLSVGDLFDEDNDGNADWVIDDFNASGTIGPGLDFAENGLVFVEVDLESLDGATNIEAIISIAVPAPTSVSALALAGLLAARRRRA